MAFGFRPEHDFSPVLGWELYQVTLDKFHVMFFFNNGWALLNVASSFSYGSADGAVAYRYDIYGQEKFLNVDRILRTKVRRIAIISAARLIIEFENGDQLTVHDDPEFRSWWFMGGYTEEDMKLPLVNINDLDRDEMTEEEIAWRASQGDSA